jgi:hypothetical protein
VRVEISTAIRIQVVVLWIVTPCREGVAASIFTLFEQNPDVSPHGVTNQNTSIPSAYDGLLYHWLLSIYLVAHFTDWAFWLGSIQN